jgi:hypothetical protein
MFQTPARNASDTASPVRMSGMARTSVADAIASTLPKAPLTSAASAGPTSGVASRIAAARARRAAAQKRSGSRKPCARRARDRSAPSASTSIRRESPVDHDAAVADGPHFRVRDGKERVCTHLADEVLTCGRSAPLRRAGRTCQADQSDPAHAVPLEWSAPEFPCSLDGLASKGLQLG